MEAAQEDQQSGENEKGGFSAARQSTDSFAARIGAKNLKIIIVAMPFVFMATVAIIIALFGKPGGEATADAPLASSVPNISGAGGIVLPGDGDIRDMALDGDRLAVHIRTTDGAVIVIYDLNEDKIVETIPVIQEE